MKRDGRLSNGFPVPFAFGDIRHRHQNGFIRFLAHRTEADFEREVTSVLHTSTKLRFLVDDIDVRCQHEAIPIPDRVDSNLVRNKKV